MGRISIDLSVVRRAAQPGLLDTTELIAEATARRAKDHEYRDSLDVVADRDGAVVTTDSSFAHLDEFGSINNPPTGAMRSAAAEHGRFVPEAKP